MTGRSYRETAARNWAESEPRIRDMEQRHSVLLGMLRSQGHGDDHPAVVYHTDMLAKTHKELAHYSSTLAPQEGLEPREHKTPTIENAMVRRAWKNEGAGADADDSG